MNKSKLLFELLSNVDIKELSKSVKTKLSDLDIDFSDSIDGLKSKFGMNTQKFNKSEVCNGEYTITTNLPGFPKKFVDVKISNGKLIIDAQYNDLTKKLSIDVGADRIVQANLKLGVLSIIMQVCESNDTEITL